MSALSIFSVIARTTALAATCIGSGALLPGQCGIDTNYGANLALADDQVSGVQMLGFAFPFAGATYDAVCVSSNGFVYLYDTTGSVPVPTDPRCCIGNLGLLLASTSPMICALWTDLNPTAPGASVHFNAAPGRAYASFIAVPEFVSTGALNTFQIVLHASGQIELHHDADCEVQSTTLIGWSPGGGATNPGMRNLSATPFTTASATVYEVFGAAPLDLGGRTTSATANGAASWTVAAPPGCAMTSLYGAGCRGFPSPPQMRPRSLSRPVINTTFQMRVQPVSATTASGVLVLGVANPNLNLFFLGLPACVLLASLDVTLPFPTGAPTTNVPVPVPNSTGLTGRSLYAQAILVDPALGAMPIALTNGVLLTFGL